MFWCLAYDYDSNGPQWHFTLIKGSAQNVSISLSKISAVHYLFVLLQSVSSWCFLGGRIPQDKSLTTISSCLIACIWIAIWARKFIFITEDHDRATFRHMDTTRSYFLFKITSFALASTGFTLPIFFNLMINWNVV